jgi:hypothetical protein
LWHIAQSGEGLDQTENTQPVLLTASIALWRVWLDLGGVAPNTWQDTHWVNTVLGCSKAMTWLMQLNWSIYAVN